MAYFNHIRTSFDGPEIYLTGISSMAVYQSATVARLYTSTGQNGGITVWNMDNLSVIEQLSFAATTELSGGMQLEIVDLGGQTALLSYGLNGNGFSGYWVGADGSLSGQFSLPAGADALMELEMVNLGGRQLFFTSSRQSAGVTCWERDTNGVLQSLEVIDVGSRQSGNDITGLDTVILGGTPYLFVLSSVNNSLSSLRLDPDGSATLVSTVSSADTLSISNPTDIEIVTLNGQSYALVTAAGSSSISVVSLNENGTMQVVDQINDTLDTRFQSVSVLETITVDGQVFILLAGADDGLTLMTLLPNGRLLHLETIADDNDMGLTDITTLSMSIRGNHIEIFTSGEGLTGIGHFRVAIDGLGEVEIATANGGTLNGSSGADQLIGDDGNDVIYGHDGNDILVDGAGQDRLYGGDGADVFVLSADGQMDTIEDFEIGVDRIDISGWGRVYSLSALTFTTTSDGVEISFGAETVRIVSADGQPLSESDFSISGLFDAWHVPVNPVVMGDQTLMGTHYADDLLGAQGNDTIIGFRGQDNLRGGAGDDVLNGESPVPGFDIAAGQVYRLYQATLDRSPGQSGHLDWTNSIVSGEQTLLQVATGFIGSAEFLNTYGNTSNTEFVTLLYQNVLGRAPGAAGLANWVDKLDSGELSREQVVLGFSESAEFRGNTEGASLEFSAAGHQAPWSDDVYRLYQATLDREPNETGLNSWTAELAGGATLESVVSGFVNSAEFRGIYGDTTNTEFVTLLYQNVLGREPGAAGLANWVGKLDSGELSREQVVLGFSQSREFIENTAADLTAFMRGLNSGDVLEGGAGDDSLFGGMGADTFVFKSADAGSDQVIGLEGWDWIDLRDFNYANAAAAMGHMVQDGDDVVFSHGDVEITFINTQIDNITNDMLLI